MRETSLVLVVYTFAVFLRTCVAGPRMFKTSHALHKQALRVRIDEELLRNVVRLKYCDSVPAPATAPEFTKVLQLARCMRALQPQ